MNVAEILKNIKAAADAAQQIAGTPLGQWVLRELQARFASELSDADKAQLDAHFADLSGRAEESRQQAGG